MEGRPPPDGDDLFEWTDSPERPRREPEAGERSAMRPEAPRGRAGRRETGEQRTVRGDTGEFERSGRRPPTGRRARRRDLPARVRRRQDFLVGFVALALVIGLTALISSGGESENSVPLERLIGQTIVAKVGAKGPSPQLLERARRGEIGGVIVFPKDVQSLRSSIQRLQEAAAAADGPPLLVMIDQEGGDVKRLPQGPPTLSPAELGRSDDADEARNQGEETGSFLRGIGVNVDLAPVLDIAQPQTTAPSIKSRTFSANPTVVSEVGTAFSEGLESGGVFATPKHFPGIGRATVSTDDRPVAVAATSDQLQGDIKPFKDVIATDPGMIMVSSASYPTLGAKKPAALSPTIVTGLLRRQLGFDGVVVTDDLEAPALGAAPETVAAAALRAGDDLLLYATKETSSADAFNGLVRAVKGGQLERAPIQSAYDRIITLKDGLD